MITGVYDYDGLNKLRGVVMRDVPLGEQSWFRCGGTADLVYHPVDVSDFRDFLLIIGEMPIILGGMANVIIRDGGIRKPVVRLPKSFADINVDGEYLIAGAAALNGTVASAAAKAGLGGLEFLSGIPGTVGGALRMNAGAYGSEVEKVLLECTTMTPDGKTHHFRVDQMDYSYRHCGLPKDHIFLHAMFQTLQEDQKTVRARLRLIKKNRQETQPIQEYTGGSTFGNPSKKELKEAGLPPETRAWNLVDQVGGRGLKIGGAMMSEQHCNFMVNAGDATASDLEDLGDELIRRVREETGLTLRWEVVRMGERNCS